MTMVIVWIGMIGGMVVLALAMSRALSPRVAYMDPGPSGRPKGWYVAHPRTGILVGPFTSKQGAFDEFYIL